MSDKFAFDRMNVPQFWTVVSADNAHDCPLGTVLAETSEHHSKDRGWVTMGYVSFDTPFGQGTYMGFPKHELRPATKLEVFAALQEFHPHGIGFRPHNLEASDIGFQLVMSSAISNWTTDGPGSATHGSMIPFSSAQLLEAQRQSNAKYEAIMDQWEVITTKQILLIIKWIKSE